MMKTTKSCIIILLTQELPNVLVLCTIHLDLQPIAWDASEKQTKDTGL